MNYEEAITEKQRHDNPYYHERELYTLYIVPKIEKEYIKFVADLKEGLKIDDELSKSYSSNNEYKLMGFMMKAYNIKEINL